MRVVALAVAVAALAVPTAATGTALPRVTVIGDSVMTAVDWNSGPLAVLERGFDVQMEVGVCRTVAGESCPFEGQRVPTLLDLVSMQGPRLGSTVVVEVGYNDPPDTFAVAVKEAVNALMGVGVQRILWLTLREAQASYTKMNADLRGVAAGYPGVLTVVDWEAAARDHADWFQTDGIHLLASGANAFAGLINEALVRAFAPPAPATPAGFYAAKRLEQAASFVAAKPVTVLCAGDPAAWTDFAANHNNPSSALGIASEIGGDTEYLASRLCGDLVWRLGTPAANQQRFAGALLTLVHEAEHLFGIADESEADCDALRVMPQVAVKFFPGYSFRNRKLLHELISRAWQAHRAKPPEYRSAC